MDDKEICVKLKKHWPPDTIDDSRSFFEIVSNFPSMLKKLTNKENRVDILEYFGKEGIGKKASYKLLKSKFTQLEKENLKGIYVFWYKEEAFYTGISRVVIKRIIQHIKGSSHFSSSLCYTMGKDRYEEISGKKHSGTRKELDFKKYSEPYKKFLKEKCQVSLLPIKSSIELYLFEVYVAVELNLHYYNKFDTH